MALVLLALFLIARWLTANAPPPPPSQAQQRWQSAWDAAQAPPPGLAWQGGGVGGDCATGPADAAWANAASLHQVLWSPFGRLETGWAVYEGLVAHEARTTCPAASPGFAAALSRWQRAHRLTPSGRLDEATFAAMRNVWYRRRPFVGVSRAACPPGADETTLATGAARDGYAGTVVRLRPAALDAYRRMVAAARAEDPQIARDPNLLTIFSSYRSPEADQARCLLVGNCDNVSRAECSPHRTGLAVDLYVGHAPGQRPDSSADSNRLYMTQGPAYRWMLAHAGEYGFANYPFEPWHWEWTGEAP